MSDDLSIPNPGYRGNRAGRYGTGQNRARQGMDPDTRRLMVFAGALGAVLVVLIGASALISRRGTEIPVVNADPRPIRVKPDNPGGMKIDGAENDVFSGGSDTADARLAPPPENPNAKALRTAAAATPPPAVAMPGSIAEPPAAVVTPPLPPPLPETRPTIVANAPATRSAVDPAPAKSQAAAAQVHPSVPGHQAIAQLAALPSEDLARSEWQRLARRWPELLTGRQPSFSRIDRDGHTFWRVRTAGFADTTQARIFCDHVRAKGGGCSVADF